MRIPLAMYYWCESHLLCITVLLASKTTISSTILNIMSSGCPVRPPRRRFRCKTERSKRVEEQRAPKESRKRKVPQRQADDQRGAWGLPKYPGYTPAISRPGAAQIHRKIAKIVFFNLRRAGAPNVYLPIQMHLIFFAPGGYTRSRICSD